MQEPLKAAKSLHTLAEHSWTWSVGVTTAPRRKPTLKQTLESLVQAGWGQIRLFAEPETTIPVEYSDLPVTWRESVLGAFPNWYLALTELVLREPHADAYLLCQDDVLLSQRLRSYLEQTLWPDPSLGVVSVYCPSHYAVGLSEGYHREDRGWQSWGALAYVFPNTAAYELLSDLRVLKHRQEGPAQGLRNIDSVVGRWCAETQKAYYVHVPSLAQHIGDTSTIWDKASNSRRRRADRFLEQIEPTSTVPDHFQPTDIPVSGSPDEAPPTQRLESTPETALLPEQIWNFVSALTRHAADGLRKCDQTEVEQRLTICQQCPAFRGDRCSECGCPCNEKKVFLNKLAWRSESCPRGLW